MPGYAKYCRYFEPQPPHEAENRVNIDIPASNTSQEHMEYEQTITSQKNIAIKEDKNLQNNFKRMLSQHLEQGYEIVRIELEKKDERKETSCLTKTIERVAISRKESI
jgi:3-dehydroquinate synthetase